jgi:ribosomal protein S18 acetylase RimI-like enzyme
VVGILVIVPGVAWSRHVAQLRIVVDPARRRRGIGRALARRGLVEAVSAGRTKLLAEVLADDDAAVALFTAVGFDPEALLKDHVRDHSGTMRDLLLLSHFVDDAWATMATTGLDELTEE